MSTEDEVKVGHVVGSAGMVKEEQTSFDQDGYYSDDLWKPIPDDVQEEYTHENSSVWVKRSAFPNGGCEGWLWSTEGLMWLDKDGFCWLRRDQ